MTTLTVAVFTNATTAIVSVDTATLESPIDNPALIGGFVGGAAALLLFGGLIAFFVARNRRAKENQNGGRVPESSNVPLHSNYGRIDIPPSSHYGGVVSRPPTNDNHHDILSPSEVGSVQL